MKVLVTGATGMIGSLVQQHCLENQRIDEVVSLLRRSSGIHHPKLTEIIVGDFMALEEGASYYEGLDVILYCQGVYTGSVDRETFTK